MLIDWNSYKRDLQHLGKVIPLEELPQPYISVDVFDIVGINDAYNVNNYILIYTIPDDKQIFLVGDLHGNYKRFKEELLEKDYHDCVFIMLGDQVMLYDDSWRQYRKLDNLFRERNCIAYFIRGNHDCAYYHTQEYYALHFTNIFPMNMGVIKYRGYEGFVFGGAISLNRMLMVEGQNYWSSFDYIDPWDRKYKNSSFDFIIGHTGPIAEGTLFNSNCDKFLVMDKELKNDLSREQEELTDMACHMTPKHWFMGHYHKNNEYTISPMDGYECQCHMVDVNCVKDFSQYFEKR